MYVAAKKVCLNMKGQCELDLFANGVFESQGSTYEADKSLDANFNEIVYIINYDC